MSSNPASAARQEGGQLAGSAADLEPAAQPTSSTLDNEDLWLQQDVADEAPDAFARERVAAHSPPSFRNDLLPCPTAAELFAEQQPPSALQSEFAAASREGMQADWDPKQPPSAASWPRHKLAEQYETSSMHFVRQGNLTAAQATFSTFSEPRSANFFTSTPSNGPVDQEQGSPAQTLLQDLSLASPPLPPQRLRHSFHSPGLQESFQQRPSAPSRSGSSNVRQQQPVSTSQLIFRLRFLKHCSLCPAPEGACQMYGPYCGKGRRACLHALQCEDPGCPNVACQTLDAFRALPPGQQPSASYGPASHTHDTGNMHQLFSETIPSGSTRNTNSSGTDGFWGPRAAAASRTPPPYFTAPLLHPDTLLDRPSRRLRTAAASPAAAAYDASWLPPLPVQHDGPEPPPPAAAANSPMLAAMQEPLDVTLARSCDEDLLQPAGQAAQAGPSGLGNAGGPRPFVGNALKSMLSPPVRTSSTAGLSRAAAPWGAAWDSFGGQQPCSPSWCSETTAHRAAQQQSQRRSLELQSGVRGVSAVADIEASAAEFSAGMPHERVSPQPANDEGRSHKRKYVV